MTVVWSLIELAFWGVVAVSLAVVVGVLVVGIVGWVPARMGRWVFDHTTGRHIETGSVRVVECEPSDTLDDIARRAEAQVLADHERDLRIIGQHARLHDEIASYLDHPSNNKRAS